MRTKSSAAELCALDTFELPISSPLDHMVVRIRCFHAKLRDAHIFVVAAQQDSSCLWRTREEGPDSRGAAEPAPAPAAVVSMKTEVPKLVGQTHLTLHLFSDGRLKTVLRLIGMGPETRLRDLFDKIDEYNRHKSVHVTRTLTGLYLTRGVPRQNPSSLWLLLHTKVRLSDYDRMSSRTLREAGYEPGVALVQLYSVSVRGLDAYGQKMESATVGGRPTGVWAETMG